MLAVYAATAQAQIEAFGGVMEKFIGDAVVGVFGAPVAHEDDPERAVRAGLAICEQAAELSGVGEAPLLLRVGDQHGRGAGAGGGARRAWGAVAGGGCGQHRVADPVGRAADGRRCGVGDV